MIVKPVLILTRVEETVLWVMQALVQPVQLGLLVAQCGGEGDDVKRAIDLFERIELLQVERAEHATLVTLTARGGRLAAEVAQLHGP